MREIVTMPVLWVSITLGVYLLSRRIYRRYTNPLTHPILVSTLIIVTILALLDVPYEKYKQGGDVISFFLGPATIALGLTLYRQLPVIRRYTLPILLGSFISAVTGVVSVVLLARALGVTELVTRSLVSKASTAPIALAITDKLGGSPSLTVIGVMIAGNLGALIGPDFLRLLRIRDPRAIGLAIGGASHAVGTSRALQEGQETGSMASVAIVLAGFFTALVAPFLVPMLLS